MSICRGLSLQKTIIQLSKNKGGPYMLTWNELQDTLPAEEAGHRVTWTYRHRTTDMDIVTDINDRDWKAAQHTPREVRPGRAGIFSFCALLNQQHLDLDVAYSSS